MPSTGFITGTGFYSLPNITIKQRRVVSTRFGDVKIEIGELAGVEIAFIPRHGAEHSLAPSEINYRANLMAMKSLGVERVLSTSVCGSLVHEWPPGALVLVDQFLNFTTGRKESFYPLDGVLAHIDVTDPYCATLHGYLRDAAEKRGLELHTGATYACFSGPRFESRAEIEMVRRLGGHLVGQTNYPECVLARELGMCYATIGVVSNYAAGIGAKLSVRDVMDGISSVAEAVAGLFETAFLALPPSYECSCRDAISQGLLSSAPGFYPAGN